MIKGEYTLILGAYIESIEELEKSIKSQREAKELLLSKLE